MKSEAATFIGAAGLHYGSVTAVSTATRAPEMGLGNIAYDSGNRGCPASGCLGEKSEC